MQLVTDALGSQRGTRVVLVIFIVLVSATAAVVIYGMDNNAFVFFGDAASHIVKSREYFDSQAPGLRNIATVWLPVPHLLLIPFVAIDPLFYSGAAGAFLGIPLLALTALIIYLIVERLTDSRFIAFTSASVFALNPNMTYIFLTPMSEPGLMFFTALAGYSFLRWVESKKVEHLFVSSSAVALATLCRYEVWPLAPFLASLAFFDWYWRRKGKQDAKIAKAAIAAMVAFAGIGFWLAWNYFLYGSALEFAHKTYTAGSAIARATLERRPQNIFLYLGQAIFIIYGPFVILLALFALFRLTRLPNIRRRVAIILFFSIPPISTTVAIALGFVQVDQWTWNWRYVLSFGLFFAICVGIGLSLLFSVIRSNIVRSLIVASLAVMPLVQLLSPSVGVETFSEAEKIFNYGPRDGAFLGAKLRDAYNGGTIALVTGYGQGQRIMLTAHIPLKQFRTIPEKRSDDFPGSAANADNYIVIGKDPFPESHLLVDYWLQRRALLLQYYSVRSEDDHYILLERKVHG
ncbi:MAG TPA: glycosyltransferase family 39 protein [Bacteroidota bacterium]|nr:glycosyltransferase family 39 protein [Bacteroidota bacterium]